LILAHDAELDLVQVNTNVRPPVVKIMDYGKYQYAQEKLESRQKSKSKAPDIKEIRLSLKINQHDLDFKSRQAKKFLDNGDKVKIALKLIGREMIFKEKVKEMLERFRQNIEGEFESPIERMGNRFFVIITKSRKNNEIKNS